MNPLKDDDRPPLKDSGWEGGEHECECVHCQEEYFGREVSYSCADCAYGKLERTG